MDREEANVEIIRSCDGKINSHNRIMIAEAFGIFSLLNLSKGEGGLLFQGWQNAVFPIFLTLTYLALVMLTLYSLARSLHYSRTISLALNDIERISEGQGILKTDTIVRVLASHYDQAQKALPRPLAEMVKLRRLKNSVVHLGVIAAVFSVVLWFVVLFMP